MPRISHRVLGAALAIAGHLLTAAVPAAAQFEEDDLEVLYELEAVRVVIDAPLAVRVGLDTRQMAERIRERLDEARIPLFLDDPGPRVAEVPSFTIRINFVSVATLVAGFYTYFAEAELREPIELFRNAAIVRNAVTWRSYPRAGTIATRHPDDLEFDVARITDDFVNAYITANADIMRRW